MQFKRRFVNNMKRLGEKHALNLLKSLPKRMAAVQKKKGGSSKHRTCNVVIVLPPVWNNIFPHLQMLYHACYAWVCSHSRSTPLYVIPVITRTSGLLRTMLQQHSDRNIFATDCRETFRVTLEPPFESRKKHSGWPRNPLLKAPRNNPGDRPGNLPLKPPKAPRSIPGDLGTSL